MLRLLVDGSHGSFMVDTKCEEAAARPTRTTRATATNCAKHLTWNSQWLRGKRGLGPGKI